MREKGRGRTTTHFFFSNDLTSRTRRSFVQLQRQHNRVCYLLRNPTAEIQFFLCQGAGRGGIRCSPVPGFGRAVLEVLVRLVHLSFSPALAAHKFHFEVERSSPPCCRSQSTNPDPAHGGYTNPKAISPHSSHTGAHYPHAPCSYAVWMRDVDGLKDREGEIII